MRRTISSLACTVIVMLLMNPAPARADSDLVYTSTEAWYLSACAGLPCPSGLPSVDPYPPDTLHVGVTTGREDSRTYVRLDTASLPTGARVTGGKLVATVSQDAGTRRPETAVLRACLATERFVSAAGSLERPPDVDCRVSAGAVYHPGAMHDVFEIPLGAFAERLSVEWGIALIPASPAQTDDWHLAFDGRQRQGGIPIVASLEYELRTTDGLDGGTATNPLPPEGLTAPIGAVPGVQPAQPESVPSAPESGRVVADRSHSVAVPGGYHYPYALLTPLALLILGAIMARTLTHPIRPYRRRSSEPMILHQLFPGISHDEDG